MLESFCMNICISNLAKGVKARSDEVDRSHLLSISLSSSAESKKARRGSEVGYQTSNSVVRCSIDDQSGRQEARLEMNANSCPVEKSQIHCNGYGLQLGILCMLYL